MSTEMTKINISYLVFNKDYITFAFELYMDKNTLNRLFCILLIVYGISINPHLAFALLLSAVCSMFVLLLFGSSDRDIVETALMNKEPTEEMLKRYSSVLTMVFTFFITFTIMLYSVFEKLL